jgi:hypothetical protein
VFKFSKLYNPNYLGFTFNFFKFKFEYFNSCFQLNLCYSHELNIYDSKLRFLFVP